MPDPIAIEKHAGRSGEHGSGNQSETREWLALFTDDQAAAVALVLAASPATVTATDGKTLKRTGVSFDEEQDGVWSCSVKYGSGELTPPTANTVRVRYTVGGATQHVTQALEHIQTYPNNADKPDFEGAIGVTSDAVEGVDVGAKAFSFSVTKTFNVDDLPDPSALYAAAWTTNDEAVTYTDTVTGVEISLAAGEGLLKSAELGEARGDGTCDVTYSFDASPNAVNLTIGTITGIDKKGWEYLWVYYVPKTGGANGSKCLMQVPKHVSIERVYDPADLQAGIGL